MSARHLKTGRFLGLCYGIVLVWGSNSVVRMPHLQCGSQELEPLLLHQPTDRRNLLKEETDFRHGLSTQIGHPRVGVRLDSSVALIQCVWLVSRRMLTEALRHWF